MSHILLDEQVFCPTKYADFAIFNPILPGLLNTLQTRGGAYFTTPPNSLVFYPRSIKFGMQSLTGNIF